MTTPPRSLLILCLAVSPAAALAQAVTAETSGFIFASAPFASAHASTIVETRDGIEVP